MAINIKKQLAPAVAIERRTHGYGNPCRYVTIHQTGNTNAGANAQAHANIQSNLNPRQASWHYSIDDKEIIQSFEDGVKCWHATDGKGPGNTTSIAIEICINSDGDYAKAVQNAAKLTKYLMTKHGLTIDKVKQHRDWYAKDCPAQLRAGYKGITWSDFLQMVQGEDIKTVKPTPTKIASVKVTAPVSGSIVDYLNFIGVDSSFANRAKLAAQHGIKGYSGTAAQNLELLAKVKKGGAKSAQAKPKASSTKTLYLPASASSWRVYPTNKAPVKGNEKGFLNPKKFGGLSYKILGNPQKDVYTIQTANFGKVNIYAAPSTGASIK